MLLRFITFLIISLNLHAAGILKSNYYVQSNDINLSNLVANVQKDITLFSFNKNRYTKRVKSRELIQLLNSHGYSKYSANSRYVKFIKKSPIDTSKIVTQIKKLYKSNYIDINIKSLNVFPRGFVKSLPDNYTVNFPKRAHLSNSGTIYIKTQNKRKIFFDYTIVAEFFVFVTKKDIKRNEELSPINITKKSIILDKFRAFPIQKIDKGSLQSNKNIKQNSIITLRDVQVLNLVKRNDIVSVNLHNKDISIEFAAKALQAGKLNDIITVRKSDGKRIKVIITGKNMVEMR